MALLTWIPILCYHDVVAAPGLADDTPYSVTATRFAAQMHLLHRQGYRTISVEAAARYVREGRAAPAKVFVITFDDGYESLRSRALPILAQLGYTATVYLIAGYVTAQPANLVRNPGVYLKPEGVRELQAAGWELGSHTSTHPDLAMLQGEQLALEIGDSRRQLRTLFDDPIATFCYPYHRRSPAAEHEVAASGYAAACGGYNIEHRLWNLSRINGALYEPWSLAFRCSPWHWRLRQNSAMRSVKQLVRARLHV